MLKVGVIGLGRMGQTRIEEILKDERCILTAVCDIEEKKLDNYNCQKFTDPYQLLDKSNIDVVFLCTFNWMLPDLAIKALSKGIYVFSEKPPGKCAQDVKRIIDEEQKHNDLFVYYGFNHRHHNSVIKAKELLDSGIIGKPLWFRGVYGKCGSQHFENEWRNQGDKSGGGILLDQGIHMIDLMYYLGFKPIDIKSYSLTQYWDINVDDSNMLIMKSDSATAMLHSLATQWKHKFSLEIGCSQGLIELSGLLTSTNSYGPEVCRYYLKDKIFDKETMGNPSVNESRYIRDNSWNIEHNEFIDAVITKKNLNMYYSKQAYDVMSIITKVYDEHF